MNTVERNDGTHDEQDIGRDKQSPHPCLRRLVMTIATVLNPAISAGKTRGERSEVSGRSSVTCSARACPG